MNPDGQVYFDDEALLPEEDKQRYNDAHVMAYVQAEYRAQALRKLLEKEDAEAR